MEHLRQTHLLLLELGASALDTAHVEHVIDERQQMVARYGDLLQVVSHSIAVVDMSGSKRSEANDGIHRCANIVAHAVEEGGLCLTGMVGYCQSLLQHKIVALHLLLLSHLFLLDLIDVEECEQTMIDNACRVILVWYQADTTPATVGKLEVFEHVRLAAYALHECREVGECRQSIGIGL